LIIAHFLASYEANGPEDNPPMPPTDKTAKSGPDLAASVINTRSAAQQAFGLVAFSRAADQA
jgi:hypothetical protein